MKHPQQPFRLVMCCGLAASVCVVAPARSRGEPRVVRPQPVQPTLSPVATAQQNLTAANGGVLKANSALQQVVSKLRKEFEATQPWKDAQQAMKAAQAASEAAKAPAAEALKKKPDYVAALAAKAKADAEKGKVFAEANSKTEDRMRVNTEAADAAKAVSKMEAEAVIGDAGVMAAEAKLNDAQAKVMQLQQQFDASTKENPEWQAARKDYDTAKEKQVAAQTAMVEAQKQQASNRRR